MNHWTVAVQVGHPKHYARETFLYPSDGSILMHGIYSSLGIHLLKTVSDGNYGIDVFTMILGWERTHASWQRVRDILHVFAFKNIGNRAFIYLMYSTAEISRHLGLHSLEGEYQKLLETTVGLAAFAGHHGDCVGVLEVVHQDDGVLAVPQHGDGDCREKDI